MPGPSAPLLSAKVDAPCLYPGWHPAEFGLKDHTVFLYDDWYYLISIYLSPEHWEDRFAYARSQDLCTWQVLDPILTQRLPGAWDAFRVWAPFVIQEEGVFYLFYTGVTQEITQSIMLATSTNPADPASWQSQGMVFQPNHPTMIWPGRGFWSDARDPTVLPGENQYYLYYTGLDRAGGIIGVALAPSLAGPWNDAGPILTLPNAIPESAGVLSYQNHYYLYYHRTQTDPGAKVHVGDRPAGPWTQNAPLSPGWAHEFWQDRDGNWRTSYLTDYSVTIDRVIWDQGQDPPMPLIQSTRHHLYLPSLKTPLVD